VYSPDTPPPSPNGSTVAKNIEHLYPLGENALTHLLSLPAAFLARYDIAETNLICAYGLTGKHDIEIEAMLKVLDTWTKRIQTYTAQKLSGHPSGSLSKLRIRAMTQALTKQLSVRYNPKLAISPVPDPEPITDPRDTFIHGLLSGGRMGTCASLPVLLVAIGRRLGYPLKLVLAPEHCFCRWDSPDERFNIEFDDRGLGFPPDNHYKEWPFKWTAKDHERERTRRYFLFSLTPQQELASFVFHRALHLNLNPKRRKVALATMRAAYRLHPCHAHAVWITHLLTTTFYPDQKWPLTPGEETAGGAAIERLKQEKRVVMIDSPQSASAHISGRKD
jgi:hypothetical protein